MNKQQSATTLINAVNTLQDLDTSIINKMCEIIQENAGCESIPCDLCVFSPSALININLDVTDRHIDE